MSINKVTQFIPVVTRMMNIVNRVMLSYYDNHSCNYENAQDQDYENDDPEPALNDCHLPL